MTKTLDPNAIGVVGQSGRNVYSHADISQDLVNVHDLKEAVNFDQTKKKKKQNCALMLINAPLIVSLVIGPHGRNAPNLVGLEQCLENE